MSAPHRKGPKNLPTLPQSAFTGTRTSDIFPPQCPSLLHPAFVIDANVALTSGNAALTEWEKESGQVLSGRVSGIVVSLSGVEPARVIKELENSLFKKQIISIVIPFDIEKPDSSIETIISTSPFPSSLSTVYVKGNDDVIAGLRWALKLGRPLDIDFQVPLSNEVLEIFDDAIAKAMADLLPIPPIVISNVLPPPGDLDIPMVKLMNHPAYLAFQSHIATLSLLPNLFIKFLPPSWNSTTPRTPLPNTSFEDKRSEDQIKEWKLRIKMYLGPVVEAFGLERIIFGSSPSGSSKVASNVGDWYNIARESLAELDVGQEAIDAVFCNNAKCVYSLTQSGAV